jgi:Ser/Thr protein kinase RdoA (MazF antagonist)
LRRYDITVDSYLGGRANRHWLVSSGSGRAVLRQYQPDPQGDVVYELTVLKALSDRGWPTPIALADPIEVDGRIWCLFQWLPGNSPKSTDSPDDLHRRGRLLAQLHNDTQALAELGQRPGCARAEEIVADPDLTNRLRAYEQLRPEQARIMRWHQDRANEYFAELDLQDRHLIVLHGDFADRNLLYEHGQLSGIIDFEGTHLNHRVSDFALAWRGKRDALIHAYDAEHQLDDIDWALLAPTLWSWAFLGVADELERILCGRTPVHDFDWQVGTLLRRSPLMDMAQKPYPS